MTEIPEQPHYDIEREKLQDRLAAIDRDPAKLQMLIAELYTEADNNPHLLYAAATHLTAITYLDRRDADHQPLLPSPENAARAFATYTRLMSMLSIERAAPRYSDDARISKRLAGAREELAFHAPLSYAMSQGADIVVLPTPAEVDFSGIEQASDVQIFFPGTNRAPLEIQVTSQPSSKEKRKQGYHPRIPVLSLAMAMGGSNKAAEVRGLLRDIGTRDDPPQGILTLPQREHDMLLGASASILATAQNWRA